MRDARIQLNLLVGVVKFFYEQLYFLIKEISKTNILKWQELNRIFEAYNKDSTRLLGIAKRIINENQKH